MKHALAIVLLALSTGAGAATVCNGTLVDNERGDRALPVRVRLPDGDRPVPVILFSHGLGGSVDAGTRWAEAWVKAGFAVIHLQHPGSDAQLWRGLAGAQAFDALRKGMTAQQFIARAADVHFVLDALASNKGIGECAFSRLNLDHIGIAGHSFGAQTVQAVAGQRFGSAGGSAPLADRRIRAAIAFSPSPSANDPDALAFGGITMPFLSVTGTADAVPMLTGVTPADRQRPFRAMPAGNKYLLVLAGADHLVFAGGEMRRPSTANDRRVESVVEQVTTHFWQNALLASGKEPLALPLGLTGDDFWIAR